MKKALPIIIAAVVVIAGAGVYLSMHKSSAKSSSDMQGMNMPPNSASSSSQSQSTNKVTIANFAFSPANITVKKGTTVTWTNQDSIAHTVTETDGKAGPGSPSLEQGKSYSFTYNTVGTFKYDCTIHPNMVGTVTVTQ